MLAVFTTATGIPLMRCRPKGEKICPRPICSIMQNFTPIGATVAEISVTGQRKTATNIYPSILTYRRVKSNDAPKKSRFADDSRRTLREN